MNPVKSNPHTYWNWFQGYAVLHPQFDYRELFNTSEATQDHSVIRYIKTYLLGINYQLSESISNRYSQTSYIAPPLTISIVCVIEAIKAFVNFYFLSLDHPIEYLLREFDDLYEITLKFT